HNTVDAVAWKAENDADAPFAKGIDKYVGGRLHDLIPCRHLPLATREKTPSGLPDLISARFAAPWRFLLPARPLDAAVQEIHDLDHLGRLLRRLWRRFIDDLRLALLHPALDQR